ncbi:hypothetical protein O181_120181 [Austropuccinia psidii MF-1]|uniref:Uncharacterized protein n=1 Tax=Austropuccinia psidii MF-1 TaxID=1389203 RepID=A0A9Q3KHX9_9BASI|nr:hypothetical protein [Austropuccinia psidii MF-1]
MCPFYSEMDALFGHKPNVTPIASYDLQEKDSLNGDDEDILLVKENNCLESPHNLHPFLNNDDDLVQVENLQDESKSKSITHSTQKHNQTLMPNLNDRSGSRQRSMDSDNACLEWDRERWNEENVSNMEKQWFEEVKLQKQMQIDEKKHTKTYGFEKEKWKPEFELKEKQCQMDLTIATLSSRRPIADVRLSL